MDRSNTKNTAANVSGGTRLSTAVFVYREFFDYQLSGGSFQTTTSSTTTTLSPLPA